MSTRLGAQLPTTSFVLPYKATKGYEATAFYKETGQEAQEWQQLLVNDIMAVGDDGLWVHTKVGYSVPRRNGKSEVLLIRELSGLKNGERILHTAHRTTTSHNSAMRLSALLDSMGYEEVIRRKKGEKYDKHYVFSKQFGLEKITLLCEGGGVCDFRTRTSKGGLGEGFDLLVIDEAQEYTLDQESSLKYVVTDSKNPQIIMCGTPPTNVSSGDVFETFRNATLRGETIDSAWEEWSVDEMTDLNDVEAWYATNPSLGSILTERTIRAEIGQDTVDFNIQRLGLWMNYNQKSEISRADWEKTMAYKQPNLTGKLFVGVKYGKNGVKVALSVGCKATSGDVFVSVYDCRSTREGNGWIVDFIARCPSIGKVCIDGAQAPRLIEDIKSAKKVNAFAVTVSELIEANATFTEAIYNGGIVHMEQPLLDKVVTNCEKRAIGNKGGFGYKSNVSEDIAPMDSVILAYWLCSTTKGHKPQKIQY